MYAHYWLSRSCCSSATVVLGIGVVVSPAPFMNRLSVVSSEFHLARNNKKPAKYEYSAGFLLRYVGCQSQKMTMSNAEQKMSAVTSSSPLQMPTLRQRQQGESRVRVPQRASLLYPQIHDKNSESRQTRNPEATHQKALL